MIDLQGKCLCLLVSTPHDTPAIASLLPNSACIAKYDWLRALVHLHCDTSQRMIGWELSCTYTVMHRNVWLGERFRALPLWYITTYDWLRAIVLLHCDASRRMIDWEISSTCTVMHRNVFGWELSCTCIVIHLNVCLAESSRAPVLWCITTYECRFHKKGT